jgi:hypothetical protein
MKRCIVVLGPVMVVALAACGSSSPQASPTVVRRAIAALGVLPIMHVVTEQPTGAVDVDLKTRRRTASVFRDELWTDRHGHRIHLVVSEGGRTVGDLLLPQDAAKSKRAFPPDPGRALASFWTGYRAALKSGRAELDRRGAVRGHPVYWLRFESALPSTSVPHPPTLEIAVDARSYEPVLSRTTFDGRRYDARILVTKAIPYRSADFRREGPSLLASAILHGNSWSTGTSNSHPRASLKTTVDAPWLTAGKSVARLELGAVNPLTARRKQKPSIHGIELVYGPVRDGLAGTRSTTIDELPRADPSIDWKGIPADSVQVDVSKGYGRSATAAHPHPRNTSFKEWTGYLEKDNLYITINTLQGERALLELARSLHRPRK